MQGSVTDADAVRRALAGIDRLYHTAAIAHLWTRDKGDFHRVNVLGTRTVLAEAARADLERIVHTSTETVLVGRRSAKAPVTVDETVVLGADDMLGPYCRSKLLAEQAMLAAARQGLPVIIVNPTMPMGPGDRRLTPPTRMILDILNGRVPAYLDCMMNIIDVRDAALGHVLAGERGAVGERYILGGTNLRMAELLALLEEVTGQPMPRRRIPYWVALAAGLGSEFVADHLTRRSPMAPLTGVRIAGRPVTFDSGKAGRDLGLPRRPLRDTLADAVAWLSEAGLVTSHPRSATD